MKCDSMLVVSGDTAGSHHPDQQKLPAQFSAAQLAQVAVVLRDQSQPLKRRFRALFSLQNAGGDLAVQHICSAFSDPSALLRHELAYCLGQIRNGAAVQRLTDVLCDSAEDAMVRHEAGEALGAIGDVASLPLLERMTQDPVCEVADTCKLAAERIRWLHRDAACDTQQAQSVSCEGELSDNPYMSVDPAPPTAEGGDEQLVSVAALRRVLFDRSQSLWQRYRAMFALRNRGGEQSVLALADALTCGLDETSVSDRDALFRHELAFVLGQMAHPAAVDQLAARLNDPHENYMVRHEAAEALGAIASERCVQLLQQHVHDQCRVVRESCEVALDMAEYEQSADCFQYADSFQQQHQDTTAVQ